MRRHILGVLGIAALIGYVVQLLMYGYSDSQQMFMAGLLLRVGLMLSVLWLCMPNLNDFFKKYPPWTFGLALLLAMALAANRSLFSIAIGFVVFFVIIQIASTFLGAKKNSQNE